MDIQGEWRYSDIQLILKYTTYIRRDLYLLHCVRDVSFVLLSQLGQRFQSRIVRHAFDFPRGPCEPLGFSAVSPTAFFYTLRAAVHAMQLQGGFGLHERVTAAPRAHPVLGWGLLSATGTRMVRDEVRNMDLFYSEGCTPYSVAMVMQVINLVALNL